MLDGRICIISGASRGLGRSVAELLASHGAALALCARGERELQVAADAIRRKHGCEVVTAALDVRDIDAVRDFARTTERDLGAAYAVVNNAAVLGPARRVARGELAGWERRPRGDAVGSLTSC